MSAREEASRSDSVRFGRIPLWLYEAGVPLQAIATYGWLHGRYGHHGRVTPSYGTLAKELGVSRGSVIAYMQRLIDVGALRVKASGATNHSSNIYEIAFDAPFPTSGTGQNTDQFDSQLVSPLTSTGRNTDQIGPELVSPLTTTGQPVVHDIDEVQDNYSDKYSTPTPTAPTQPRRDGGGGGESINQEDSKHRAQARSLISSLPETHRPGRGGSGELIAAVAELLALNWPEHCLLDKLSGELPHTVGNITKLLIARLPEPFEYVAASATAPAQRGNQWRDTDPCGKCDPIDRTRLSDDGKLSPCPVCNPVRHADHINRFGDPRDQKQREEDDWYHRRWEWEQARKRGQYMPEPVNAPGHLYEGLI